MGAKVIVEIVPTKSTILVFTQTPRVILVRLASDTSPAHVVIPSGIICWLGRTAFNAVRSPRSVVGIHHSETQCLSIVCVGSARAVLAPTVGTCPTIPCIVSIVDEHFGSDLLIRRSSFAIPF